MTNNIKLILLIFTLICLKSLNSQVFTPGQYRDGIYDREHTVNKKYIPYTYLREGDVQWSKRVWREIDMREKINQTLYYPIIPVNGRTSLFQLLAGAVRTQKVTAFKDEEFLKPLPIDEVTKSFIDCKDIIKTDVDTVTGNEVETKTNVCDSTSIYNKIIKFRLKEDWFFDKQKSVMEVRILGICPVINIVKESGDLVEKELFWLYFPECRPVFAMNEVYNSKNDSERRSFDDIFMKRQFSSNITKESNVFDRSVDEYLKGLDALLENERIKNDIFKYEHDFWQF
jgi:gliding motility associated protien GldN